MTNNLMNILLVLFCTLVLMMILFMGIVIGRMIVT